MEPGAENLDIRRIAVMTGLAIVFLTAFVSLQSGQQIKSSETGFNGNDVMFMNMMIVHHDQAIEMAELADNRSSNENILELSNNISEAQTRENRQMEAWMAELGHGAANHHAMAGMASDEEMRELRNSNGTEFDQLFAELMIEHHEGGIAMAQNFKDSGENTELREMQQGMIEAQQKEIEKMQTWREEDSL